MFTENLSIANTRLKSLSSSKSSDFMKRCYFCCWGGGSFPQSFRTVNMRISFLRWTATGSYIRLKKLSADSKEYHLEKQRQASPDPHHNPKICHN